MSTIQDIHAFEERTDDYIEDYLGGSYNTDDVDKISGIANSWLFLN